VKFPHVALLSFLLAPIAGTQQPATFSLGGGVKSSDGKPLARANIELRGNGGGASTYTAVSAENGTFQLSAIQPGQYRLLASRNGYLPLEYGQSYPRDSPDFRRRQIATGYQAVHDPSRDSAWPHFHGERSSRR
jgi:hypothetical protein